MFFIKTISKVAGFIGLIQLSSFTHFPVAKAAEDPATRTDKIEGIVYDDANKDAILDQGELPRSGVMVRLLDRKGNQLAEQPTTALGSFGFTNLEPGIYRLRISFSNEHSIRTVGLKVAPELPATFLTIPVITSESDYDFVRLGLLNEDTADGEEATAFMP